MCKDKKGKSRPKRTKISQSNLAFSFSEAYSAESVLYGAIDESSRMENITTETKHGSTPDIKVKSGCCAICTSDPISKTGRRSQKIKLISLLLFPSLGLIALASGHLYQAVKDRDEILNFETQIMGSHSLAKLVHALQVERQTVLLTSNISSEEAFKRTNESVDRLKQWPLCGHENGQQFTFYMETQRRNISEAHTHSTHWSVYFYTNVTSCLIKTLLSRTGEILHKTLWRELMGYKMIIRAKENLGILLTYGELFISTGQLELKMYVELSVNSKLMQDHLDTAKLHSLQTREIISKHERINEIVIQNYTVFQKEWEESNSFSSASSAVATEFFKLSVSYLSALEDIRDEIEATLFFKMGEEKKNTEYIEGAYIALVVLSAVSGPILATMMCELTNKLYCFAQNLVQKSNQLKQEKKRADDLLCQMLPRAVAKQLIRKRTVIAEYFESSTVFFSDVVGFTELSAKISPIQVVEVLNDIYQFFDNCIDSYNVYKVETIGDAYMVVSGIPIRNGTRHVTEVCSMALELKQGCDKLQCPHAPDIKLQIRIGIHTGPCAAGVVGNKMPRYCLFGDTVNTASRMESSGLPKKIHISEAVKDLLTSSSEAFNVERRGNMNIKGKGVMETYWLQPKTYT